MSYYDTPSAPVHTCSRPNSADNENRLYVNRRVQQVNFPRYHGFVVAQTVTFWAYFGTADIFDVAARVLSLLVDACEGFRMTPQPKRNPEH